MSDTDTTGQTDVTDVVCRAVRLLAPEPPPRVHPDDLLVGDLGYHSLALIELAFTLEDLFGLDDELMQEATGVNRVGDVAELIDRAVGEGVARMPAPAMLHDVADQYGTTW